MNRRRFLRRAALCGAGASLLRSPVVAGLTEDMGHGLAATDTQNPDTTNMDIEKLEKS